MTRGQALAALVCAVAGCWSEEPRIDDTFTADEWAFLATEFRLPQLANCPDSLPNDCGFAMSFGRDLFFDPALAGPVLIDDAAAPGEPGESGTLSCAGCHDPNNYFIDTRSQPPNVSIGAAPKRTKHNAMSVLNLSYKEAVAKQNCAERPDDILCARVFSWTGKYPSAGDVLLLAGPRAMNSNGEQVSFAIRSNESHRNSYITLFDGIPQDCVRDPMSNELSCVCPINDLARCHSPDQVFANVSLLFDAYLHNLRSTGSPFDRYVTSEVTDNRTPRVEGFGDPERRGLSIFIGKGMCIDCHTGPLLSDLKFHNTGVPQTGANVVATDGGLGDEEDLEPAFRMQRLGEFLTPPLRHVAMTAPYMHAGQLDSLSDVIEFYRRGGSADGFVGIKDRRIQPLEITDDEARDLEAFLRSLTGKTDPFWQPPGQP